MASFTPQTVPYLPPSTHPLHTLDVWRPNPTAEALWVIFIHGGAWRDPTQTRTMGHPLLNNLLRTFPPLTLNASSIDYRLSPHPTHPPTAETVTHPAHLEDVRAALGFLRSRYQMRRFVLVGHSAGATLALQVLGAGGAAVDGGVKAAVCLEGVYDIPGLVREYPDYVGFISGAFGPAPVVDGESHHAWVEASPAGDAVCSGLGSFLEAGEGKIVLVQSRQDELLSLQQTRLMEEALGKRVTAGGRVETVIGDFGGHNEVLTDTGVWAIVERIVREVQSEITAHS